MWPPPWDQIYFLFGNCLIVWFYSSTEIMPGVSNSGTTCYWWKRRKKIEWNNSNCLACNLNFNLGELLWTNWKASKEKYFHRYAWTLERHQWRIEGPGCFRVIYLSQHSIARFTEHHCIEHGMNKSSIWARFWRKKALQMLN